MFFRKGIFWSPTIGQIITSLGIVHILDSVQKLAIDSMKHIDRGGKEHAYSVIFFFNKKNIWEF